MEIHGHRVGEFALVEVIKCGRQQHQIPGAQRQSLVLEVAGTPCVRNWKSRAGATTPRTASGISSGARSNLLAMPAVARQKSS